jgi:hypothetical protein
MTNFIFPSDSSRAECNELNRVCEELERISDERDALVAYMNKVLDAWMFDDTGIHDKREHHVRLPNARYEAVNKSIMTTPNASLSSLIAEKQAEAIEGWFNQIRFMEGLNTYDCIESAEIYAKELREKAKK